MSATKGLPSTQMHPAGKSTIAEMLAKGWIKTQMVTGGVASYLITPVGEAALRQKSHFQSVKNLSPFGAGMC
jgi:hypothetical protein